MGEWLFHVGLAFISGAVGSQFMWWIRRGNRQIQVTPAGRHAARCRSCGATPADSMPGERPIIYHLPTCPFRRTWTDGMGISGQGHEAP